MAAGDIPGEHAASVQVPGNESQVLRQSGEVIDAAERSRSAAAVVDGALEVVDDQRQLPALLPAPTDGGLQVAASAAVSLADDLDHDEHRSPGGAQRQVLQTRSQTLEAQGHIGRSSRAGLGEGILQMDAATVALGAEHRDGLVAGERQGESACSGGPFLKVDADEGGLDGDAGLRLSRLHGDDSGEEANNDGQSNAPAAMVAHGLMRRDRHRWSGHRRADGLASALVAVQGDADLRDQGRVETGLPLAIGGAKSSGIADQDPLVPAFDPSPGEDEAGLHRDGGEAEFDQELFQRFRLPQGLGNMVPVDDVVDADLVAGHRDLLLGFLVGVVVDRFGLQGEDATGPDHHMVDVESREGEVMEDEGLMVAHALVQSFADQLLATQTQAIRAQAPQATDGHERHRDGGHARRRDQHPGIGGGGRHQGHDRRGKNSDEDAADVGHLGDGFIAMLIEVLLKTLPRVAQGSLVEGPVHGRTVERWLRS